MLKNATIEILNNPTNAPIKSIYVDVEEPKSESDFDINIENYKFTISKILIIDYIEQSIDLSSYVKINGTLYKVLKIRTPDDFSMEVDLYKCKRQVV